MYRIRVVTRYPHNRPDQPRKYLTHGRYQTLTCKVPDEAAVYKSKDEARAARDAFLKDDFHRDIYTLHLEAS